MRFSILALLLLPASASAATTANKNQHSHPKLRRRHLLNEQQVSLKVNLAANCQVKAKQTVKLKRIDCVSNLSSCVS
jgi:hypothetical protein